MRKLIIANGHSEDMAMLAATFAGSFDITCVSSPDSFPKNIDAFDLLLVDDGFCAESGTGFLAEINSRTYIPVLVLTSVDNPSSAVEALRAGANYIVKFGPYQEALPTAIDELIAKLSERELMKQTVVELKARILELEQKLAERTALQPKEEDALLQPTGKRKLVFADILSSLKVEGGPNLPPAPQVQTEFKQLLDGGADHRRIAELLKKDPAVSSKLIAVANSAAYRRSQDNKVTTLDQAVSRLGITVTAQYVNVMANRSLYMLNQKKYVSLMLRLWQHSLASAYACEATSNALNLALDTDPFILGLLHDIGKLVIVHILAQLEARSVDGYSIGEIVDVAESNHALFGNSLFKRWEFSDTFARVALHHGDLGAVSNEILVVHFGNTVAKNVGYSLADHEQEPLPATRSGQFFKISPETSDKICESTRVHMDSAGGILL
jgi:HD-like signal output (HDOD) protein/DNA-binding NarL/FixJ family response regulator